MSKFECVFIPLLFFVCLIIGGIYYARYTQDIVVPIKQNSSHEQSGLIVYPSMIAVPQKMTVHIVHTKPDALVESTEVITVRPVAKQYDDSPLQQIIEPEDELESFIKRLPCDAMCQARCMILVCDL